MPRGQYFCFALFSLAVIVSPARPAETKDAAQPALMVRLESIQALMADIKYLATLTGQEEQGKQLDGLMRSELGSKGLKGIDPKKPLGAYAMVSPDIVGSSGVILVPIADEKAVLDVLEQAIGKPEKDADGIYSVAVRGMEVYFRFANHYVYVAARNKSSLDKKKLLDPAKMLASARPSTASIVLHLDQIPDGLKEIALGQLGVELANAKDDQPKGETKVQHQFREALLDDLEKQVKRLVSEANSLEVRLNIDRHQHELTAAATFSGKPGSQLASDIAAFGQAKSLFGGFLVADAAVNSLAHLALPADLHKAFEPVVDEIVARALEQETNEARRRQGEKILKALSPTLKAGEVDAAVSFRGPSADKVYTLVAGVKLKDGNTLEKALQEVVRSLPTRDQAKFKFALETAGKVKINRIDVQDMLDEKGRQVVGSNPIYFAIHDNALLVTAGPDGLKALKEALAVGPQTGPQLQLNMEMSRLGTLLARHHPAAAKLIEENLGKIPKGQDALRITVEGGKVLKARLVVKADVVKAFSKIHKVTRQQFQEPQKNR